MNMKMNRLTKAFFRFLPQGFLRYAAWRQGVRIKKLGYAEKLFADCRSIDIQPLSGGNRGFILFLDRQFSLWFFQDGDHFIFDGYEIGEYEAGEVTVFDRLAE